MGLFIDGALSASNPFHLTLVFFAGYLSLSFGIADFVLYIWVDDVFVRRNKILSILRKQEAVLVFCGLYFLIYFDIFECSQTMLK